MSKFKIGDLVRITGDVTDGTDHLDGKVGSVIEVFDDDILVNVPGEGFYWFIWNHNAEVVEQPK